MDFGGFDLTSLMRSMQNTPGASSGGLPQIKTNMAPPANFWEGNNFRIGAEGMQEQPHQPAPAPAQGPPPSGPAPSRPPVPPTVGIGGGAMQQGGAQNPFIPNPTPQAQQPPKTQNPFLPEQGELTLGAPQSAPPSMPAIWRNAVPYIDPSMYQLAPSAADPYDDGSGKRAVQGYGKNPFRGGM